MAEMCECKHPKNYHNVAGCGGVVEYRTSAVINHKPCDCPGFAPPAEGMNEKCPEGRSVLEQTDPKQDAKRFVDGMTELRRRAELRRLEEAAKQFLRDTGVGPVAEHMSVHAWMAAFAYTQVHQALNNQTESTGTAANSNHL